MRLYANENIPLGLVLELRRLGHDVLTTFESGKAGQAIPDEDVLPFATLEHRVVVTHNRRHFVRLHLEQVAHAGILVCSVDLNHGALAERIDAALLEDMAGQLIRVNRPSSR
jgi:Domain of unknown function (DUF5615)